MTRLSWEWEPGTFRVVSQSERTPGQDAPQEWADERFYAIVTDLVGTPTELVDPDGQIAASPRTALWGQAGSDAVGQASTPLRFPGQYHDPESALNYNYFRHYDPAAGRYESSDPIGLLASPNPHTYVTNPVTRLDPLGLAPTGCGMAPQSILPTPGVGSPKLQNIVDDLYKGTTNPGRTGTGTTADALRYELSTGQRVFGKSHLQKAGDSLRGLENWMKANPGAPYHVRLVSRSVSDDLLDALGSAP